MTDLNWKPPAGAAFRPWLRRFSVWLACAGAGYVLLQASLAVAVAAAPNALLAAPAAMALPAALAERGARSFKTAHATGEAGVLSAWLLEPSGSSMEGTVVLLHGVRMDKRSSMPMALALSDAGYRTVLVDLPGHGESTGSYLTYGSGEARALSGLLDALAATGVRLGPVGAYGFSYGGAIAINWAAHDTRVASVVAVAPFASLREVVRDYRRKYLPAIFRFVPDSLLQGAIDEAGWLGGYDPDASAPIQNVSTSKAPLLLVHGDADTQVPLRHSQQLHLASQGRAKLLVVRGATHDAMPIDATHVIRRESVAWFGSRMSAMIQNDGGG